MAILTIPRDLDPTLFQLLASSNEGQAKIDDNIRRLNESIGSIEKMLSGWYAHRNELAPISRLPKELLAQIFVHLRDMLAAPADTDDPDGINEWIWVTHVCQHWRQLALEYKTLWTSININGFTEDHADLYELQAAKSWPLPVNLTASLFSHDYPLLTNIMTKEPRMNLNQAVLCGRYLGQFLGGLTTSSASLRTLILHGANQIPNLLFGGETPRLQELQIAECSGIAWDAGVFRSPSLRRLTLKGLNHPSRPSSHQLLQILRAISSNLEELIVVQALPTHVPAVSGRDKPHLTHLKSLQVSDKSALVTYFLKTFNMPSTTKIQAQMLGCERLPQDTAGRMALADSIGRHFLKFFATLSNCRSSLLEPVALVLRLMPHDDNSLAMLVVDGMLGHSKDSQDSDGEQQPFKLTYTYNKFDLRFSGIDDPCASCGQKVHSVFEKYGLPRQLWNVSICTSCRGSCHSRPWFPMLTPEEYAIPGISFEKVEPLELRQDTTKFNRPTRIPHGSWTTFARLPKLRQIVVRGFCVGEFGDFWQSDNHTFPALKFLVFDEVRAPPLLIKKLQNGLEIRHGDADIRLHYLEFTDKCSGLSIQDLDPILGQYVSTLQAPKKQDAFAYPLWEWPPPPEETPEDHFQRMIAQMGYSESSPPSPSDCGS